MLRGLPTGAATSGQTVAAGNTSLTPAGLSFVSTRWSCERGPWLNGKSCHAGAMVPKGWTATKLSNRDDAKFTGNSGATFLRVAEGPYTMTTAKAVAKKQARLKTVLARATTSVYQAG